jgi:hypothetical protein
LRAKSIKIKKSRRAIDRIFYSKKLFFISSFCTSNPVLLTKVKVKIERIGKMVLFHFIRYLRISVAKLQQKLNNTTKGRNILFIFFKTGITTPFVDIFIFHSSTACYSR